MRVQLPLRSLTLLLLLLAGPTAGYFWDAPTSMCQPCGRFGYTCTTCTPQGCTSRSSTLRRELRPQRRSA